jgi:hypothetical protein
LSDLVGIYDDSNVSDGEKKEKISGNKEIEERIESPLELVDFEKENLSADIFNDRYSDMVKLTLHVKNKSDKRITAYKGVIVIHDSFGEKLATMNVKDSNCSINPGEIGFSDFGTEDNMFFDEEIYDKLAPVSRENMSIELKNIEVVYSDK